MKPHVLLVLSAVLLSGCATITAPRDEIARVPIVSEAGDGMRIEDAKLQVVDSRLVVSGSVHRIYRWYPVGNFHLDVDFLDARRERLAFKSSPLLFPRTRFGPSMPAQFSAPVESWPEGVTEIVVRTHAGYKHR